MTAPVVRRATAELVDGNGVRQGIDAALDAPVAPETRLRLSVYIGATQSAALRLGHYTVVVKLTNSAATPEPFVDFVSFPLQVVSNAQGCGFPSSLVSA